MAEHEDIETTTQFDPENEVDISKLDKVKKTREQNPFSHIYAEDPNNHSMKLKNDLSIKAFRTDLHVKCMARLIIRNPSWKCLFPNNYNPNNKNIGKSWDKLAEIIGHHKIKQDPIEILFNIIETLFDTFLRSVNGTLKVLQIITEISNNFKTGIQNLGDAQNKAMENNNEANKKNLSETLLSVLNVASTDIRKITSVGSTVCEDVQVLMQHTEKPIEDYEFMNKLLEMFPTFKNIENMKEKVNQGTNSTSKLNNIFDSQKQWKPAKLETLSSIFYTPTPSEESLVHSMIDQFTTTEDLQIINTTDANNKYTQTEVVDKSNELRETTNMNSSVATTKLQNESQSQITPSESIPNPIETNLVKQMTSTHTQTTISSEMAILNRKAALKRRVTPNWNTKAKKVNYEHVKCPNCDERFANQHSLKRHIETKHEKLKVKCTKCGLETREDYLKKHIAFFCKGKNIPDEENEKNKSKPDVKKTRKKLEPATETKPGIRRTKRKRE